MKRGPAATVGGLSSGDPGAVGCPITANWEALSVASNSIEPTDVTFRRNLVIFFIFSNILSIRVLWVYSRIWISFLKFLERN
jgi:hypothetical protein